MNQGLFIRKITAHKWITVPDWLEPWPSMFGLPRWISEFVDAREPRKYESPSWLNAGDISGDCLKDLGTDDGKLSVFLVPVGDPDAIQNVGAAMIASSKKLARFEYYPINFDTLRAVGLEVVPSPTSGETIDPEVNALHHDVVELSGAKLDRLARELKRSAAKKEVSKKDIGKRIQDRVIAGKISRDRVAEGIRKDLKL